MLSKAHPWWPRITADLQGAGSTLGDIEHSGKLVALRQLLGECGVGLQPGTNAGAGVESAVGQHRCLIFAQASTPFLPAGEL